MLSIKLNAYLAIIVGSGLIIGEVIRSWGKDRNFLFIIDDFIFGSILILGAIFILKKLKFAYPILLAGWASCVGMIYGSLVSKIINLENNFESNINNNLLTFLIGLAFISAILGLLWSILLYKKH